MSSSNTSEMFSSSDTLGLGFILAAGGISILFVLGALIYTAIKRSRGTLYNKDVSDSNLFLTLMIAELVYEIGIMFNSRWAVDGAVHEGALCTTQGILKQIGNNGISFTSLAITLHTFFELVANRPPPKWASVLTIIAIYLCTGLVVLVPNIIHRHETYYGNTGFWCFITSKYTTERLVSDYIWVWLAGFALAILYPILAILLLKWGQNHNQAAHRRLAMKLMLFPIAYNLSVLPNSIARWLSFTNHDVPDQFLLAANALHAFSGFFNVVVFLFTHPAMFF